MWSRNGSSGFIVGVNSKPVPSVGGRPPIHDHAGRMVDESEADDGLSVTGGGQRRNHGIQQRQGQRGAQARAGTCGGAAISW